MHEIWNNIESGSNSGWIYDPKSSDFGWVVKYVLDALCFVYPCRRLIDLDISMPAIDRSFTIELQVPPLAAMRC